jgi:hypothetical protein
MDANDINAKLCDAAKRGDLREVLAVLEENGSSHGIQYTFEELLPLLENNSKLDSFVDALEANRRLQEAARQGDIGGIRAALAEGANDFSGALLEAARNNHIFISSYLINCGAKLDICGNIYNKLACESGALLYLAISNENTQLFALLLENNIDNKLEIIKKHKPPFWPGTRISWSTPYNIVEHTALTWAAHCGKDAIVQALLERGGVSRSERLRAAKEALAGGHPLLAATLAGGAWKPEKPARSA